MRTMLIFFTTLALLCMDLTNGKPWEATKAKDVGEESHHQVKRAEEVLLGNQQNKADENQNSMNVADKRDVPDVSNSDIPSDLEKEDLDDETQYEPVSLPVMYQPQNRDTYYYRPELYDMPYLEEDRKKRNAISKRGFNRATRAKREMQIDPEDVLNLLALWEMEHRKHSAEQKPIGSRYQYEIANEDINDAESDEPESEGTWMQGPIIPAHRFSNGKQRYYPSYQWVSGPTANQQAKHYIKQNPDYFRAISQLAGKSHEKEHQGQTHERYMI